MSKQKIKERSYDFAVQIARFVRSLPKDASGLVLSRQLIRSGTSIGANVEEASAAFSKAEFTYKMSIALRESRETHYWLRLIRDASLLNGDGVQRLINECEEMRKVLSAIAKTSRQTRTLHSSL